MLANITKSAIKLWYLPRLILRLNYDFYRRHYPDLRKFDDRTLRIHWRRFGWREGRIPSWTALRRHFWFRGVSPRRADYLAYLALNNDLLLSGYETVSQGAVHFLKHGRRERRAFGFDLPEEFVNEMAANRVDESWPSIPSQAGPTPKWDSRAFAQFASRLEMQLSITSVDDFLIKTYIFFAGHTPLGIDLDRWCTRIDYGTPRSIPFGLIARNEMERLSRQYREAISPNMTASPGVTAGPVQIGLMGPAVMSTATWRERALTAMEEAGPSSFVDLATNQASPRPRAAPRKRLTKGVLDVAVVCSIYRPGRYLPSFLRNIEEQTIFDSTEVIVIAVALSTDELALIYSFASRNPNVVVEEFAERIGIYQAWNRGITLSTAPFITNMNVDDLRRPDSLEIQRNTLLRFEWADVVFQDVQLMISRDLSWNIIEQIGASTRLPITGVKTLVSSLNPPHNGPMWRRNLHDSVGFFREDLQSASDWEFWIRVSLAGHLFLGSSDPHVGYFINPQGLSTSSDGVALKEQKALLTKYARHLEVPAATGEELRPSTQAPPLSRADRYSAGMISILLETRKGSLK